MLKKLLATTIIFIISGLQFTALAQEEKPAAREIKPQITSEDHIPLGKKALFDATESEVLEDEGPVSYTWRFGDETPQQKGKEVVHSFEETGRYEVTLTVEQAALKEELTKEIFVYDKKALLITDRTIESEFDQITNQAAIFGTWMKLISAVDEESQFLAEETLVNKISEENDFIKDADILLFYTKSNLGLQAFSRYWKRLEKKDEFNILGKTLIKVSDENISTVTRLAEQSFNVIQPQFILVTRKEAFNPIFQTHSISELLNSLGQRGIEYQIVDERSKRPFYYVLSKAVTSFVAQGLPPNIIYLILALPFITFIISFSRQVIGISTFGVYSPTMLALAFMILGVSFGASVLLVVVLISYALRLIFEKVNLLYIPKVALLLSLISLSFLGIIWFLVATESSISIALAIFPMLVMSTISEKFLSTQSEEGIKSAFLASIETIIVSLIAYYFVSWSYFSDLLMASPELVLIPLIGNIILGKFTGLRLTEYFRFRSLLKGDFEE